MMSSQGHYRVKGMAEYKDFKDDVHHGLDELINFQNEYS